jgi:hypothetical protein
MSPYMTRSFDHSGYYETRLLLALAGLAAAIYWWRRDRDSRFLVMFGTGVFFQALLEYRLAAGGLRGANYSLSVFGVTLQGLPQYVFQGIAEGGILCLTAYIFVDLVVNRAQRSRRLPVYAVLCLLIVVMAAVTGAMAGGRPITSPRPMLAPSSVFTIPMYVLGSLALMWLKGRDAFYHLGLFAAGLFLYVVLTFEPLHLLGARYVAFPDGAGGFVKAAGFEQWRWILYSHLWEVTAAKIHYFAIPYFLNLIVLPERYR